MSKLEIFCALGLGFMLGSFCFVGLPSERPVEASTSTESTKAGPVIVELFTSEGCSSCPPADALLSELSRTNGANIASLSEHVSYWNYIGWADPYSAPVFDNRQYKYVSRLRLRSAYTPQVIVNGIEQTIGNDRSSVSEAIAKALRTPPLQLPLSTSFKAPRVLAVTIDTAGIKEKSGEINLAITEDGITSNVRSGENVGHVLHHDAVVRTYKSKSITNNEHDLVTIDIELKPSWNRSKLNLVAFFQQSSSGKIGYSRIVPASKWK